MTDLTRENKRLEAEISTLKKPKSPGPGWSVFKGDYMDKEKRDETREEIELQQSSPGHENHWLEMDFVELADHADKQDAEVERLDALLTHQRHETEHWARQYLELATDHDAVCLIEFNSADCLIQRESTKQACGVCMFNHWRVEAEAGEIVPIGGT